MKVGGIDLAGNPKNDTGFCIMQTTDDRKHVSTSILHSDSEIIDILKETKPDLVAVDAPLNYIGKNRECDSELHDYGVLPVTLRGMETLAIRGCALAKKLEEHNIDFIEVSSKSTAKILGLHNKKERIMQKNLITSGIEGSIDQRMLSKDELDAIFAAITAYLHINNKTTTAGKEDEIIIIPKI